MNKAYPMSPFDSTRPPENTLQYLNLCVKKIGTYIQDIRDDTIKKQL